MKINLSLRVLEKRCDGYHDIHTLFWRRPSPEFLVIETDFSRAKGDVLQVYGASIPGENLVLKALRRVRETLSIAQLPPTLALRLIKAIPPGSGVGAGSGNAASLIRWLRRNGCPVSDVHAAALGADIAFLANNESLAMAEGVGEVLTPLGETLDLVSVVVFPKWHVSTQRAYAELDEMRKDALATISLEGARRETRDVITQLAGGRCVGLLPNDFLAQLQHRYVQYDLFFCDAAKEGALAWGLCGSGSAMFAVFKKAYDFSAMQRRIQNADWVSKIFFTC